MSPSIIFFSKLSIPFSDVIKWYIFDIWEHMDVCISSSDMHDFILNSVFSHFISFVKSNICIELINELILSDIIPYLNWTGIFDALSVEFKNSGTKNLSLVSEYVINL